MSTIRSVGTRANRNNSPLPRSGVNQEGSDSSSVEIRAGVEPEGSRVDHGMVNAALLATGRHVGSPRGGDPSPAVEASGASHARTGDTETETPSIRELEQTHANAQGKTKECYEKHNLKQVKFDARAQAIGRSVGIVVGGALCAAAVGLAWPVLGSLVAGVVGVGVLAGVYGMVVTIGSQPIRHVAHVMSRDGKVLLRSQNELNEARRGELDAKFALSLAQQQQAVTMTAVNSNQPNPRTSQRRNRLSPFPLYSWLPRIFAARTRNNRRGNQTTL